MKRLTNYFIIIVAYASLGCSTKSGELKISNENLNLDKTDSTDKTFKEYELIKQGFTSNHYLSTSNLISEFLRSYPKSKYADSIKYIQKQIDLIRTKENVKRDSLSKYDATTYFNNLGLPTLDSINEKDYKLSDHNGNFDFLEFDNKLFRSPYELNWYLSIQNVGDMTCVAVCHFNDCENEISLYSIDSLFNIHSSMTVYFNGCTSEPAPNFPFNGYIINEYKRKNWTIFNRDNTFTVFDRTYFTVEDSKKGKTAIEIGKEINIRYRLNKEGKFIVVEDKSFEKDYVIPLYKVPV